MDSVTGQTFAGDLTTRSVDLNLTAGERVHCTFTNSKLGTVIIKKAYGSRRRQRLQSSAVAGRLHVSMTAAAS